MCINTVSATGGLDKLLRSVQIVIVYRLFLAAGFLVIFIAATFYLFHGRYIMDLASSENKARVERCELGLDWYEDHDADLPRGQAKEDWRRDVCKCLQR